MVDDERDLFNDGTSLLESVINLLYDRIDLVDGETGLATFLSFKICAVENFTIIATDSTSLREKTYPRSAKVY